MASYLRVIFLFAVFLSATTFAMPTARSAPKVVASIQPIHSLVASVMEGIGTPVILLDGNSSPHSFSLRPSQARQLSEADLIFWIGEDLESFLEKPLQSLAKNNVLVKLSKAPGIRLLKYKESGAWKEENLHEESRDERAEKKQEKHSDHDDHEGHAHGEHNMHVWLDPRNAGHMVNVIVGKLKTLDPGNAPAYEANARRVSARLKALDVKLEQSLKLVSAAPFLVFHDAYQYLENRYELNAAGTITVNPDLKPGAKRLSLLRKKIKHTGVVCIFSEPQFEPAIVKMLVDDSNAKSGILDPLGAGITPGPDGYFQLMERMAASLSRCLSPSS